MLRKSGRIFYHEEKKFHAKSRRRKEKKKRTDTVDENQFAKIHVYSRFGTFTSSKPVDAVALPLNELLSPYSCFSFLSWSFKV